jgi:aminoglycoside phosphotransferase (APT) family kinase protein
MTASTVAYDLVHSPVLRHQLPGLRTALDAETMRTRLQALLVAPTHLIDACVPGKVWYRGAEGCDLRYTLLLTDRASGAVRTATVLGRSLSDLDQAAAYRQTRVEPLIPGLRGRAGPLRAAAWVPDLALVVHAFPLDPTLPTLAAALDPAGMLPRFRSHLGCTAADCSVEVVHHARGGRCVLRYAAGERVVYGKVYADDAGGARQELLAAVHGAVPAGVRVPCPLGYVPGVRLSLCGHVPGRTATLTDPRQRTSVVVVAARMAALLHATPVVPPVSRSFAGEVAELHQELGVIRPVWPDAAAEIAAVLARLEARSQQVPALPATFCHGDFTPAQVLLDPSASGVVDFDTAAAGEPALDLGRFLAYLHFALAKQGSRVGPALGQAFLSRYLSAYAAAAGHRPGDVDAFVARVFLYERLSLLRLAARACLQLKTRRLETALSLLSQEVL